MQRPSDDKPKKHPPQAEASAPRRPQAGQAEQAPTQQSGASTDVQFTDWASI